MVLVSATNDCPGVSRARGNNGLLPHLLMLRPLSSDLLPSSDLLVQLLLSDG